MYIQLAHQKLSVLIQVILRPILVLLITPLQKIFSWFISCSCCISPWCLAAVGMKIICVFLWQFLWLFQWTIFCQKCGFYTIFRHLTPPNCNKIVQITWNFHRKSIILNIVSYLSLFICLLNFIIPFWFLDIWSS